MHAPFAFATTLVCTLAISGAAGAAPAAGASAAALLPAVAVVHIENFKYRPQPLAVHVGDRVTFVNDDDEAHTVTASDATFDSGGLDTHDTWQHVFAKAGTYAYFCQLHPYMKATIVVSAPGAK